MVRIPPFHIMSEVEVRVRFTAVALLNFLIFFSFLFIRISTSLGANFFRRKSDKEAKASVPESSLYFVWMKKRAPK